MKIDGKLNTILEGIIERGKKLGYDLTEIYKNKKYNFKQIADKYLKEKELSTVEKNFFNDIKTYHNLLEEKIRQFIKKENNE